MDDLVEPAVATGRLRRWRLTRPLLASMGAVTVGHRVARFAGEPFRVGRSQPESCAAATSATPGDLSEGRLRCLHSLVDLVLQSFDFTVQAAQCAL